MTIQDRRLARLAKVSSSNNQDGADEDNGGKIIHVVTVVTVTY